MTFGWVDINKVSGGGDADIEVSVNSPNLTANSRSMTFNFIAPNGENKAKLTITQEATGSVIIAYNDNIITRNDTIIAYGNN